MLSMVLMSPLKNADGGPMILMGSAMFLMAPSMVLMGRPAMLMFLMAGHESADSVSIDLSDLIGYHI